MKLSELSKKQMLVVWIAIGLIVLSFLCPPWTVGMGTYGRSWSKGYSLLTSPPVGATGIDLERVFLQVFAVVLVAVGMMVTMVRADADRDARRRREERKGAHRQQAETNTERVRQEMEAVASHDQPALNATRGTRKPRWAAGVVLAIAGLLVAYAIRMPHRHISAIAQEPGSPKRIGVAKSGWQIIIEPDGAEHLFPQDMPDSRIQAEMARICLKTGIPGNRLPGDAEMTDYSLIIDGKRIILHWNWPQPPTKADAEKIVADYRGAHSASPTASEQAMANLRAKYPEYNDMSDSELALRVIAKYPVYLDLLGRYTFSSGPPLAMFRDPAFQTLDVKARRKIIDDVLSHDAEYGRLTPGDLPVEGLCKVRPMGGASRRYTWAKLPGGSWAKIPSTWTREEALRHFRTDPRTAHLFNRGGSADALQPKK